MDMENQYCELNSISVDKSLSINQRKKVFIAQINDPYCFLCNGVMVHIKYALNGESLEKILTDFLVSKK